MPILKNNLMNHISALKSMLLQLKVYRNNPSMKKRDMAYQIENQKIRILTTLNRSGKAGGSISHLSYLYTKRLHIYTQNASPKPYTQKG